MAGLGNKCFIVIDGKEGKQYDVIVATGGGRVVFNSTGTLHCLAVKGKGIYQVEER